jgi:hypothetical protein
MTVDPFDDCTFWYTTEYLQATGAFNWSTRVASLSFPGCAAGKQSQTINFTSGAPAGASYLGTPYTVTAAATSGLPVKLVIAAASSGVCALSGGGSGSQVTFTGVGTCTIEASQGGSATYKAAPLVQQTFAVGKGAQTINFTSSAPGSAAYNGSTYTVTATATSGLAVTLAIDPLAAGICALDGSGSGAHVSFTGVGTCLIDANQSGNASYNAAGTAQQSFAVGKGAQTISFTSTAPAGAVFGGAAYTVTASASSSLAVSLSIDGTSSTVCQIDGGAHVSFIGVGTCVVDADQGGSANYNAAPQKQQSFAVGQAAQTITFDSSGPGNASAGGTNYQVLASASSGLAVTLAIDGSATAVCQLDGSASGANVSFIHAGTCKINASQSGDANHSAAPPKQQSFTVAPGAPTQLVFTQQPASVFVGETLATIAVTEKDAFGDVIDDNASVVDFSVPACSGSVAIGSATMAHGVATLASAQRFYSATGPASLQVSAHTGALSGSSNGFVVQANVGLTFADGFEGCRL